MPGRNLLGSLPFEFTKFLGKLKDDKDTKFNDAIDVGGFPYEAKIERIKRIELFSKGTTAMDVLDGLRVSYKMQGTDKLEVKSHGIVMGTGVTKIGDVTLNENQILVGASGRLKKLATSPDKDGRISTISLTVYSKLTGVDNTDGPYGNTENLGDAWGSFGPIVAFQGTFQGTTVTDRGLTLLGFTKVIQGVPGFGIATA
ncbi:hypothetical protein HD554DRAFT_2175118 [Boletus coccyginus]|nr:hypothetical protein HD554DRAFT_2175118 [Boletus coccyginus]